MSADRVFRSGGGTPPTQALLDLASCYIIETAGDVVGYPIARLYLALLMVLTD